MTTWLERLAKPSPTNEAPTHAELRRNDLLVAALVLFALFLALGIRNQVLTASQTVRLGENLPRIAYPDGWRQRTTAENLLHVVDPGSPSTFNTQMVVVGRALRTDESLEDARADRGIKLATSLPSYRELEAERMIVLNDQPALVSTYAYIADPTLDTAASGLPVVVEAQDIMFLGSGQFQVVTLAADATAWEEEQAEFGIITNSLRLRPLPEEGVGELAPHEPGLAPGPVNPQAQSTPGGDAADPGPADTETGGEESSGAAPGSFGGDTQEDTGVAPGEGETPSTLGTPAAEPGSAAGENESSNETQNGGSE